MENPLVQLSLNNARVLGGKYMYSGCGQGEVASNVAAVIRSSTVGSILYDS